MTNKKQLNEVRLTAAGKLFISAVAAKLAAYGLRRLVGSMEEQTEPQEPETSFPFKLTGTPEQIAAVMNVVQASKEYQEAVVEPNATVEHVIEKLNARNVAKLEFEEKTSYPWPL